MRRLIAVPLLLLGCATTETRPPPVERVDEGIYRIQIIGDSGALATRRQVERAWSTAASEACQSAAVDVIDDSSTTADPESPVGLAVMGLPVSRRSFEALHAKSGYIRCADSPYALADAAFIVRDVQARRELPPDLAPCEAEGKSSLAAALKRRADERLAAGDARGAFGCLLRAASLGNDLRDGDADAQFRVGRMYERGEGVAASLMESLRWYRRAAINGHAGAQFRVSELAPQ